MKTRRRWELLIVLFLCTVVSKAEAGTINQEIARATRENEAFLHAQNQRIDRELSAHKERISREIQEARERLHAQADAFLQAEGKKKGEQTQRDIRQCQEILDRKLALLKERRSQASAAVEARNERLKQRRQALKAKKDQYFIAPDSTLGLLSQEAEIRLRERAQVCQEMARRQTAQTQGLTQDLLIRSGIFPQLQPMIAEESRQLTQEILETNQRAGQ